MLWTVRFRMVSVPLDLIPMSCSAYGELIFMLQKMMVLQQQRSKAR